MGKPVGRTIFKLTAGAVAKLRTPGYYGDGGNLWLQVSPAGTKSWVFRFTLAGRAREMGLGPVLDVSLAEARDRAQECRRLVREGVDPIEQRRERMAATKTAAPLFATAAEAYITAHGPKWRNAKHREQWRSTLTTYAAPVIGQMPVHLVETGHVLSILRPIWTTKTETARRLRQRIEAVLDWATVAGYRTGSNPARWKGHLDVLLPDPGKVATVEHHAALPYQQIGTFVAALRQQPGTAARAVELITLTACRTSEAFNAKATEFDLDAAIWTIPGERMKAGREHRVALSKQAVRLLRTLVADDVGHVFPGAKENQPLSNMAGLQLLKRMGLGEYTVHGLRATFKTWATEQTSYPRETVEGALAHVTRDKTEAAYLRGDALEKRRRLMQAWADHCDRPAQGGAVVGMKARAA